MRNRLKRLENWKYHFQNFHKYLTFLVDFVVAEHWCRGAMHLDICWVKREIKTYAWVTLYLGFKWCCLVKMKVAKTYYFRLIVGIWYHGQLLTNASIYVLWEECQWVFSYGKKCKQNIDNYRPVAVLPVFSKLLERVICITDYIFFSQIYID